MIFRIHQANQHRLTVPGIEARTLVSNHHFPRHSHDQFGVGVISSGAQRSWSSVGLVNAEAGDVIMVNPGEIHDGIPVDSKARTWRMIYIDPALLAREVEEEIAKPAELVRPVAQDPCLSMHFARLFACLTASYSEPLEREENLLRSLIYLLQHHGTAQTSSSGPTPSIAKALQRLDSSPDRQISLAELAALSSVSRFQLLRAFACELGITPHAYLMQRRVCLARQLLAKGLPLAQTAIQAGFSDQSHMTRAFARQFGVTPKRYQAAIS